MAEVYTRYSDQELALIVDFTAASNTVMCKQIANLKAVGKGTGKDLAR